MNLFVAVIPKNPALLPSFKEALIKAEPATIPFHADEHSRVIFSNGEILAASFSIHASGCPIKNYVGVDEQSFCTFNGIPIISYHNDEPWGSALMRGLASGEINVENLGGYYNLIYIHRNKIKAWNCLTRMEPIYWLENQDCVALGNRASLIWALGNRSLDFDYDEMALMTLSTAGWLVNNATPFSGVKVLPNGYKIVATADSLTIEPYKPYTFCELENIDNQGELIDNIQNQLIEGITYFSRFRNKISVNLSGGKDSRILAAACNQSGISYTCITSGGELAPDMIVAKEVVQLLNNPEHIISNRPSLDYIPHVDLFQKVKHHIKVGDGMLNINDPTYEIRKKPACILAGHGGELLRGGYDRAITRPVVTNRELALKFINNLTLHNSMYLFKDEAIQYQCAKNEQITDEFFQSGFPLQNLYDWMYTVYREPRGIGNIRQASSFGAFSFSPFLNDNLLKSAWKLPLAFRKEEYLYFQLLKQINPQLATHRFADSRWKYEINEPLPGTSIDEWMTRAPLPPCPPSQSGHSWRVGYDDYFKPILRDYLLQNANGKINSYIDKNKLEQLFDAEPPTGHSMIRSVFGLFTATYLLNNDWL